MGAIIECCPKGGNVGRSAALLAPSLLTPGLHEQASGLDDRHRASRHARYRCRRGDRRLRAGADGTERHGARREWQAAGTVPDG